VDPLRAAGLARDQLARLARPSGSFDASRYFRSAGDLRFHNVGMPRVRALARTIVSTNGDTWGLDGTLQFAGALMTDPHLEAKALGIEAMARYRRRFTSRLLPTWKGWLAGNLSANWATTDAMCGLLIGPLLLAEPRLAGKMPAWSRDPNMWVRRASAVALIPCVRKGLALGTAYRIARRLHADPEDLIQKAAGWMLREAGKADPVRLERYLRANGPIIPRTTLRYAIERFPLEKRRQLLTVTRPRKAGRAGG
jgi:3-methyladenine DNA glycosylase AlkD